MKSHIKLNGLIFKVIEIACVIYLKSLAINKNTPRLIEAR